MLIANSRYVLSLKAAISTIGPEFLGGNLGSTMRYTIIEVTSTTSPMALTVQAKPIFGNNCRTISGNTIPPVAPPHALAETATVFLLEK